MDSSLTCASELLAFNLADSFVCQPPGVAAARSAGLDGIVKQVVSQPLQVTVTHKGILGQMTERGKGKRREEKMGLSWVCHRNKKRRGPCGLYKVVSGVMHFSNALQPCAICLISD